jgi:hypothetical protein
MAACRRATPRGMRAVAALALLLFLLLLVELGLRVGYPCDLLAWSESPFMTNLLKLAHGLPIYGDPSDLNSYIYSPGLEYLTYAVLAPFGLALDVRWCRLVNLLVGLAAAVCAGTLIGRVAGPLRGTRYDRRLILVCSCATALVVFERQTADVLHPDNLLLLDGALALLLCYEALHRGSRSLAIVAIAVAGLGIAVKQTALLAPLGTTVALVLGRRWGVRGVTLLTVVFATTGAFATWFLLGDPNRRFFVLDVPGSQAMVYGDILVSLESFCRGHRLLLLAMAPFSAATILRAEPRAGRDFLLAWVALGLGDAAPSALAALKFMGSDNNFGLSSLWLWLVNAVAVVYLGDRARRPGEMAGLSELIACLSAGVLLSLVPMSLPPPAAAYRYCDDIVAAVGADLRVGRRVMLSKGTTPLLRNGSFRVPLDRSAPITDVMWAGKLWALDAMKQRLAAGSYDRLYFVGPWVAGRLPLERYVETGKIPAPPPPSLGSLRLPYWSGVRFSLELKPVTIYALRDAPEGATR